jgi:NADPH:quinone reductase
MRAVVLAQFGGLEHLTLSAVPRPKAGPGEVLIEVKTVAANRVDFDVVRHQGIGRRARAPHIMGIDPAGVIVEVGDRVENLVVGDRVVAKPSVSCGDCRFCLSGVDHACERLTNVGVDYAGGFADYTALPARTVFRIPNSLSFAEATAIAHSFPVALLMLDDRAKLRPDDVVLVTGAAGAIGSAAVQLALLRGARVIAAVGSPAKVEYARTLGAESVIDYGRTPEFAEEVKRLAGPMGVTLYVEPMGTPELWRQALKTLGRMGRAVVCSYHGGGAVELDLRWLYQNRLSILGSSGSSIAGFRQILELAGAARIHANIHAVLPLERYAEAYRLLHERLNTGKVVLRVAEDTGDPQLGRP